MEAVPEYRRKKREYNNGKDEIIQKLSDKGGNIGSHSKCEFAVRIMLEALAD